MKEPEEPEPTLREAGGRLEVLQIYRLLQLIHEGDRLQMEKLINRGVKNLVNLSEPRDGKAALHVAAETFNRDLVHFLLSRGANPNIQDRKGRTPLMLAAELGNDAVVLLLAERQADARLLDNDGKGVLFYCIHPTSRHSRCLQVALKCRADVNNVSADGLHVFQMSCKKAPECEPMSVMLLEGGADPNATHQKSGVTALMEASRAGSLQLVRSILRRGGNPNAVDRTYLSAAHYAAMGGHFEVVQVLSAFSADLGLISLESCTPLHYAAANGNANCCRFLAQRGCNPKLKNRDGLLPRQIAKDSGHKAAAKELRKAEKQQGKGKESSGPLLSDVWALTLHHWTHEFEAELRRAFGDESDSVHKETLVSVLLEDLKAPVDPDQLDAVVSAHEKGRDGNISVNDFIKGVKFIKKPFLLSSYAPKKKKGEKGGKGGKKRGKFVLPLPICTQPVEAMPRRPDGGPPAFMIETYNKPSDVLRFDPDCPPPHPIMDDSRWYVEKPDRVYVSVNDCVKSADLASLDHAFSRGVPVDVQDQFYKTPLMVACSSGNYEVASFLLQHGADVNTTDGFLWTPLHHAASSGDVDLVELLLKAGASLEAVALGGGTPLMRAIESSKPACVDFLIRAGARVNVQTSKGEDCLDVARAFGDSRVIDLVKEKMDSLPKPKDSGKGKEKGGKNQKPKPAKAKGFSAGGSVHAEASAAGLPVNQQRESQSVILLNTRITAGNSSTVDQNLVPKPVWGNPVSTQQLMSQVDRRKQTSVDLDLEDLIWTWRTRSGPGGPDVDLEDLLMPFSLESQEQKRNQKKPFMDV